MSRHGGGHGGGHGHGHGGHYGGGYGGRWGGYGGRWGGYGGWGGYGSGLLLGTALSVPLLAGAAIAASQPATTVIYNTSPPVNPIAVIPTGNPEVVAQQYPQYQVYYVPRT